MPENSIDLHQFGSKVEPFLKGVSSAMLGLSYHDDRNAAPRSPLGAHFFVTLAG
jgi:hypothetical protein